MNDVSILFGNSELNDFDVFISNPSDDSVQIEFPQSNICVSLWGEDKLDDLLLAMLQAYGYYKIDVDKAKTALSELNDTLVKGEII